ncbi:glycosyltransferase family 4 protein [Palleronia rufa]|uniref:glycosyltransferase family 4 protein n=1 Tax=Palleronia rufa TaxID=1530186 RepID=UPI0006911B60|nr:glycosyltransferase family 4 protein [Palleronia rufa]
MSATILFPFVGGDTVGGSHVSALAVARRLDAARFRPLVLLHRGGGTLEDYVRDAGIETRIIDAPIMAPKAVRGALDVSPAAYMARSLPRMIRLIRETAADIVHTNDGRMHVNWALPAKLGGAKLLWHHREDPSKRFANWFAPHLADRMLTVSHFATPPRARRVMGDRVEVARSPFDFSPTPRDVTAERARLRQEIGAGADALVLGYVGFLNLRKRPDVFVKVIARAAGRMPDREVHGCIFGQEETPGMMDTVRAEIARLGLCDRVHLMGHRPGIAGPMSALDMLIVTALNEPFGRTLIEAMDLGVPVVATDHGGNPEAIDHGKTGLLVAHDDLDGFAAAVQDLADSPAYRRSIADRARESVHARFGLRPSVQSVERAYEALLGSAYGACPGKGAPDADATRGAAVR